MIYLLTHPTEQPGERAMSYFTHPVSVDHFWRTLTFILSRYPFLRLSDIWFGEVGT